MSSEGDPIRDYIRANMRTNTREAITKELVAAGHDQGHVDAVWQEEWRAASVSGTRRSLTALSVSLFIVGGVLGGLGALLIGGVSSGQEAAPGLVFWALYAVVYLAVGYGILRLVGWAVPRFGITGSPAALIGQLLVPAYGVLMFGGCLATYGIAQQVTR
jgi:hypothetical protein